MVKLNKKAGLVIAAVFALLGLANNNAKAFDNPDRTPLFLEHGSQVGGTHSTDSFHESHASHGSHESHASHASHASGY